MKNILIHIEFVKMTGAGNDFILIDNRTHKLTLEWEKIAPKLCDRRFGVGADGILILTESRMANVKMDYYNADGSFGGMCGNGGRCVAHYVMACQISDEISIEALDYVYKASREGEKIRLHMKEPSDWKPNIQLEVGNENIRCHFVNTGSPHVVVFTTDLSRGDESYERSDVLKLGSSIRTHSYFSPDGTNVNFVYDHDTSSPMMRTFERGVEGETLACGTGAVASAIAMHRIHNYPLPIAIKTRGGETLLVDFEKKRETISKVSLTGSARLSFRGSVILNPEQFQIAR